MDDARAAFTGGREGFGDRSKMLIFFVSISFKVEHARAGIDVLAAAEATIENLRGNFILIDR
jgi:hypothetical protein